jgi:4-hydroxythreonine-4-phosphate dehydrogenase
MWQLCRPLVIGSAEVLEWARRFAPACPEPVAVDSSDAECPEDRIPVLQGDVTVPALRVGSLDPEAGRCAAEWLRLAVDLTVSGKTQGIVTCPLTKEGLQKAGYPYAGHTDMIAALTSSPDYRMCLFAGPMRVVHITAHLPLAEALRQVETDRIVSSVRIANVALARLGFKPGRIAVAGLNPHAGEAGMLGAEEIERIEPAVRRCREEGIVCTGPYPPDTVFRRMREGEFDLVIAMYHDQGHIPMKLIAMDEGVNVTLGIPIVRTSPDHGTAYDIAGKGVAREDSLCAAIELAARMTTVQG